MSLLRSLLIFTFLLLFHQLAFAQNFSRLNYVDLPSSSRIDFRTGFKVSCAGIDFSKYPQFFPLLVTLESVDLSEKTYNKIAEEFYALDSEGQRRILSQLDQGRLISSVDLPVRKGWYLFSICSDQQQSQRCTDKVNYNLMIDNNYRDHLFFQQIVFYDLNRFYFPKTVYKLQHLDKIKDLVFPGVSAGTLTTNFTLQSLAIEKVDGSMLVWIPYFPGERFCKQK